ncbi:MAG: ATP-grasp domain-containing protein [Nanoarchaeota archaeon]|nr:ATP-grasp domain-containing protein [Nanoarchaeota archaeon]
MVNFAEYFGKKLLNERLDISELNKTNNSKFISWLDFLIEKRIIPERLALDSIPIPRGILTSSIDEVVTAVENLKNEVVLKAQALTGGRGKAGGIKLVKNKTGLDIDEYISLVKEEAQTLIGMDLKGHRISQLYVEPIVKIHKESYMAITLDDASRKPMIMWASEGGMDIEELAKQEKLQTITINDITNPGNFIDIMNIPKNLKPDEIKSLMLNLYYRSWIYDLNLVEINPLITTESGEILAGDAKVTLDSDAIDRHPDIVEYWNKSWNYTLTESENRESQAKQIGCSYVALSGNIGCIVNGAGLAMATNDLLYEQGIEPANFCDLTGGATAYRVYEAIKLVLSDPKIKGFLLNIHGGIVKTDAVAEGVIRAKNVFEERKVPYAIRIIGTNEERAHELLKDEGIKIYTEISDAVTYLKKVVKK